MIVSDTSLLPGSPIYAKGLYATLGEPSYSTSSVSSGASVGLFAEQHMIEDASDLVCGSGDGLRCTELGAHASEELTEVALGATERVGTHPECERSSTLHLSRFAGGHLAPADSFFRT